MYDRRRRDEPSEPEPDTDPEDVVLLREIRDALLQRTPDGHAGALQGPATSREGLGGTPKGGTEAPGPA